MSLVEDTHSLSRDHFEMPEKVLGSCDRYGCWCQGSADVDLELVNAGVTGWGRVVLAGLHSIGISTVRRTWHTQSPERRGGQPGSMESEAWRAQNT